MYSHPLPGFHNAAMISRRKLLFAASALVAGAPFYGYAKDARVPISDMHSHYGMSSRRMGDSGLAQEMREQGVALVAWKLVADARWIRSTDKGIVQVSEPVPGELARYFNAALDRMGAYLTAQKLKVVLSKADVDACIAGESGVVLASEGADFLEGRIENLDAAYAKGLRHLQLVHYMRTPVGDFQTTEPVHNGLSLMGQQLVEKCGAQGVLVDLAHCTAAGVDQALAIAKVPVIWSHGWVDGDGGDWRDPYGHMKRRLSLAHAKKIAAGGGVVGLWGLGFSRPGPGWAVGLGDTLGYAKEIASLVGKIGADHVAFGSDIEGLGTSWAINNYTHLRSVVDHLHDMKLGSSVIERVAYGNYARVLKSAMKS